MPPPISSVLLFDVFEVLVWGEAVLGSGATCSPKTSNRLVDVPTGTHVTSVAIGLSVLMASSLTWFGLMTFRPVTIYA